jgi:hypothetical protein
MKKITLIVPMLLFLGFSNVQAQENAQKEVKMEITPKKEVKYAVVISFISIGSGIDGVSYGKIDSLIKNNPKKPTVARARTGREGESTMSLELKELSKKEKKAFIKEVEKLAANKNLVKIQKNVVVKMP